LHSPIYRSSRELPRPYISAESIKKVIRALERNEDLEADVQKCIEEYISIFSDVLIPLLRQSAPLQELEDYLKTPEAMTPIDLLSPFMPEGKTIRNEVDHYLAVRIVQVVPSTRIADTASTHFQKCADSRAAEWRKKLASFTPERPVVHRGIVVTSMFHFFLPKNILF